MKIGKVKRKTADPEEAKALLQQAQERLQFVTEKDITPINAKFVLENAYEAVREAAQSLMSLKGFKPYSHEATISFVDEYFGFTEEQIALFDHFRKLRCDSVYRAVPVLQEDAAECLEFASKFVEEVSKLE